MQTELASMEGRTIARPNRSPSPPPTGAGRGFNGGPDNCPAKHANTHSCAPAGPSLQWRAGQLPGQTGVKSAVELDSALLQWRAGQLPGQTG